jgi:23S rRNA (cytosine1962-C5)-methyltransferase
MNQFLYLKKNADRRLWQGHLWIYSNEIDAAKSPLKSFSPGEIVTVLTSQGKAIGQAYANPAPLITARLLSRDLHTVFDQDFFIARFRAALHLREQFFSQPFYRLVYSEADQLPGLIVDRYDDVLVVQLNTAGMDKLREPILDALKVVIKPTAIIFRNDSSSRKIENLESEVSVAFGTAPKFLTVIEDDVKFLVPALSGQKTGWFYDHRSNRQRLNQWVKGKRVLDVFSYLGGWGIQALCHGAKEVVSIDSSATAIAQQIENAKLNHVADRLTTLTNDAFEQLKELKAQGEQFDVVVLDPPALIKRRKDLHAGMQAYYFINKVGLELLAPGGLLVSASCSHHLSEVDLRGIIQQLSEKMSRSAKLVAQGHQGLDHPIHLAIPETEYLKAFFVQA